MTGKMGGKFHCNLSRVLKFVEMYKLRDPKEGFSLNCEFLSWHIVETIASLTSLNLALYG